MPGLADTVHEFDPITGEGSGCVYRSLVAEDTVMPWRTLCRDGVVHDLIRCDSADGYSRAYAAALHRVDHGRVPTLGSVRDTF